LAAYPVFRPVPPPETRLPSRPMHILYYLRALLRKLRTGDGFPVPPSSASFLACSLLFSPYLFFEIENFIFPSLIKARIFDQWVLKSLDIPPPFLVHDDMLSFSLLRPLPYTGRVRRSDFFKGNLGPFLHSLPLSCLLSRQLLSPVPPPSSPNTNSPFKSFSGHFSEKYALHSFRSPSSLPKKKCTRSVRLLSFHSALNASTSRPTPRAYLRPVRYRYIFVFAFRLLL